MIIEQDVHEAGRETADDDRETPLYFHDVLITPFTDLVDEPSGGHFHRGGPHWPDWDEQVGARHQRGGRPVDTEPVTVDAQDRVSGPIAWGGPVDWNFGHQVGDFSMRLVPTLAVDPGAIVAFSAHPRWGWREIEDTPLYFRQILDWVGLPEERCLFITRPTLVEQLFVLPQAEQIGGLGPSSRHLDRMDELTAQRVGTQPARAEILYVSRAAMHARLAGERYLERMLAVAGATIIRPETLSLSEQLVAYASADVLIFAGGSASTGARLLGRSLGDVIVLLRRDEGAAGPYSRSQLAPRSRSLRYPRVSHAVLCGLSASGRPLEVAGLTLLDEAALLDGLADAAPGLRGLWDPAEYADARDEDVIDWVGRSRNESYLQGDASREHLFGTLRDSGLGHLVDKVGPLLPAPVPPRPARPAPPTVDPAATSSDRAPRTVAVNPRPWTATRIEQIAGWIGARTYLEIGVGTGSTLGDVHAETRVGVDPKPRVDPALAGEPGVEIVALRSDEYVAALDPGRRFDIILIDGLHLFEQAYRDLCAALLHTGPDSVILVADTWPRDEVAALRDQDRSIRTQPAAGGPGAAWQGDVYKVVLAVHDFHPGLDYATLDDWGSPQTVIWRSAADRRRPRFDSLETISRITLHDLEQHRDVMRFSTLAEAFGRFSARRPGAAQH